MIVFATAPKRGGGRRRAIRQQMGKGSGRERTVCPGSPYLRSENPRDPYNLTARAVCSTLAKKSLATRPGKRVRNQAPPSSSDAAMRRVERLAYLLDNSIRVPGTKYRIGYDAIVGLVPGVGDAAGLALSSYIIVEAVRLGVPSRAIVQMVFNVGLETLAGTVPIAGDLFDATWKANARNMDLIRAHHEPDFVSLRPSNSRYLRNAIVIMMAGLGAVIVLLVLLIRWVVGTGVFS